MDALPLDLQVGEIKHSGRGALKNALIHPFVRVRSISSTGVFRWQPINYHCIPLQPSPRPPGNSDGRCTVLSDHEAGCVCVYVRNINETGIWSRLRQARDTVEIIEFYVTL